MFTGLFLAGFCLVALPRGTAQIMAGTTLLVVCLTATAGASAERRPEAGPRQPFVMYMHRG